MEAVRTVRSLLVGVALLILGNGALGTLVGVRLSGAGFGPVAVGIVGAAYFAGLTAGSLYAHTVFARVGHIRAFAVFASVFSAASLMHALAVDAVLWALLRLVEGFCMAGLYMCIESWLNDKATNKTRGKVLSLYMVTLYGAMATGQQMLNLSDPTRTHAFMLISILVSLALVPVSLTRTSPPAPPGVASLGFRRLYRASPLGVAGVFTSGLVMGSIYGLAPVFSLASGFGVSGTALFMSVLILGCMALQWPLGQLSDRFDRRSVVIGLSLALAAVSAGMIGAAGLGGKAVLLPVALLFGGLAATLYPVCLAHTNDHLDKADLVAASGGLILTYSVGATIGPILASSVMSACGPAGLFAFIAACGVASALYGLWRMRKPPLGGRLRGVGGGGDAHPPAGAGGGARRLPGGAADDARGHAARPARKRGRDAAAGDGGSGPGAGRRGHRRCSRVASGATLRRARRRRRRGGLQQGGAAQGAGAGRIEGGARVLQGSVVPDDQIAPLPFVAVLERAVVEGPAHLLEQRPALAVRHADHADGGLLVHPHRPASGPGLGPEHRVGRGRRGGVADDELPPAGGCRVVVVGVDAGQAAGGLVDVPGEAGAGADGI